jgi:ribonuclease P protein component
VKNTIKSTNEISSLFKTAQRVNTRSFIALVKHTHGLRGRVAFIAGKRLGAAPKRNKAKRLMREAARATAIPWTGVDVVFITQERTLSTRLDVIISDMQRVKTRVAKKEDGLVSYNGKEGVAASTTEATSTTEARVQGI